MENRKVRKVNLILLLIAAVFVFTSCGIYEGHDSSYTEVNTVKGALFEVPSSFLGQATAINTISDAENYEGLYVYKDGEAEYFMFQMDSIAVICEKGTSYGFKDAEDKVSAFSNSQINGKAWITENDDTKVETDNSDGVFKMLARANAAITLTTNQYADFDGYITSVDNGEYEYTLFAGATGTEELTEEQDTICKHIAMSFKIDASYKELVTVDTASEEIEDTTEDTEGTASEEEPVEEVTESTEPTEEEIEDEATTEEDTVVIEDVDESEESTEDNTGENEEPSEEVAEDDTTEEPTEDESVNEETVDEVPAEVIEVPEPTVEAKVDVLANPTESDYYNPLTITQTGQYSPNTYKEGQPTDVESIHIDNLYTGSDAQTLLKTLGVTRKAKDGTSYQVIEYTTSCDITKYYTNIKITGLDGERLKFRGISYTTRTYDVLTKAESGDNRYTKLYCYYEVPNGCKEYALSIGEYAGGLGQLAFYQINN